MNRADELRSVWDGRARMDAEYYIKCDLDDRSPQTFLASGVRDIEHFAAPWFGERREKALDIGCGLGRLTRALGDHFDVVVGVDISDEMVRRARDYDPPVPGNCSFLRVDGTGDLPFDDESFDFVFSYIVFQHLPTRDMVVRYLHECGRVLRAGGVARVQVNTRHRSFRERLSIGIVPSRRVPILGRKLRFKIDPHDHMGVVLRESECRRMIATAGLELLDIGPLGEHYTWLTAKKSAKRSSAT